MDLVTFLFLSFLGLLPLQGHIMCRRALSPQPPGGWRFPPGLIITAILVVNNLRDIENDRKGNKRTLAVLFGEQFTKTEYLLSMAGAYLILLPAASLGIVSWFSLLAWGSLPLAFRAARVVLTQKGRPLNAALAGTGQTAFVFSLLFWVGMLF